MKMPEEGYTDNGCFVQHKSSMIYHSNGVFDLSAYFSKQQYWSETRRT